ncbi:MAG: 4-(cytidine 5'-diphospho)-2-C-methyl-D-erythritol kinase [Verrucomicrobia bacterium]|nr:4-(cytidine 5'-diphospho)-2-C-methyl-D-erythritol kinase [Verrucomicrobiota bacterium]
MTLARTSPGKVNLLLNILGRRADGFHTLETVLQPVAVCDELEFTRAGQTVRLTCNLPGLPTDAGNLVHRAATAFLAAASIHEGVKIHLTKKLPIAAGMGGGSGNAAVTLLALNELFGAPLDAAKLHAIAASLGSDIPFFLQDRPALATGRGELVTPLDAFPAFRGVFIVLIHPGFGISTAWAYRELAKFPAALHGQPGRAEKLLAALQAGDLARAAGEFYNSLEAPALRKHPVLALYQEFLRAHGAAAALMSGRGSPTVALAPGRGAAEELVEKFKTRFGAHGWTAIAAL